MKLSTIMKKGIAIGVVGAMVAGLAACGGNDANNNASANNEANSSGSGTTIQFQQWWGVELPEGYLIQRQLSHPVRQMEQSRIS